MNAYLDELFSLRARVALVTGGSAGIGFAIATALGRAGADVVLVARHEPGLEAAATALSSQGVTASYIVADLGLRPDIERVCDAAPGERGSVDVLVNCAGVNVRPPMSDLTDAEWETTMAVNMTAPYLLGRQFGPRMAERGWGRIINVGSQQSVSAFGNSGAYGVSKAAVAGLSRSQAEAWSARGVCCNTIIPGFVVTAMTQHVVAEPAREAALAARSMIGRNGLPADFAGVAVFLASDASGYLTGQTVFVDGGFSVH